MALTKKQKVHGIVHSTSATAAGVGAGLAQFPMGDIFPLTAIQMGMISAIALVHARKISEVTATAILGTFTAGLFGRAVSQVLLGWVPALGNAVNAATAAALTEAIGWAAHNFFERLGDEPLSEEELKVRAEKGGKR